MNLWGLRGARRLLILFIFCFSPAAWAQQDLYISLKDPGVPARDLILNGERLDRDDLAQKLIDEPGFDLSQLEPDVNDTYVGPENTTSPDFSLFPNEDDTLTWDSALPSSKRIFRSRAVSKNNQSFRIVVSTYSHAFLVRSALLKRLGYQQPAMKSYRRLRVDFPSASEAEKFENEIATQLTFRSSKWVTGKINEGKTLILQDVTLEPGRVEAQEYHYGVIPGSSIQGLRSIRALIIPIALTEIPQTPDFFSPELGRIMSENLAVPYLYASQFQGETTLADTLWIARRIAKLTRKDWVQIIQTGDYPKDITALLVEKIIARRNHLVKLLNLNEPIFPVQLRLNTGAIKNGVVTQNQYPGYALDFMAGQAPESPLSLPEILRFILIEGVSKGIGELLRYANDELLTIQNIQGLAESRQKELMQKIQNHYAQNPGQPFIEPVQTWGGVFGGLQVQATRNVVTGQYFGGESQVSLVDVFSVSMNGGAFIGLGGFQNFSPSFLSQLNISRSYVHVRPVKRVKEALETNWADVFVPGFFMGLADALNSETDPKKSIEAFTKDLQDNELFYINSNVTLGARLSAQIPLGALVSLPGVALGSFTLSGGGTGMVFDRMTFQKTDGGLQIYLQDVSSKMADWALDANFWIRVARFNESLRKGSATTEAFLLDLSNSSKINWEFAAEALKEIFSTGKTTKLRENFHPFTLKHELDSLSQRFQMLRWQWFNMEERHSLKIQPTRDMTKGEDPAKFERNLFAHRLHETQGTSDYQLLSDIVAGFFPGSGGLTAQSGNNPAETFLGQSLNRTVSYETELTGMTETTRLGPEIRKGLIRLERRWQGPEIPLQTLQLYLNEAEKNYALDGKTKLFNRDALANTQSLQFFSIQNTLFIYPKGAIQLERYLFQDIEKLYSDLSNRAGKKVIERTCLAARVNHPSDGPISRNLVMPTISEKTNNRTFKVQCTLPWIRDLVNLRYRKRSTPEERIALINWAAFLLEKNLKFRDFAEITGLGNVFFQSKINGFRKGDPIGDSDLISNTLGEINFSQGSGVFSELSEKWNLLSSEVRANYLSGGGF